MLSMARRPLEAERVLGPYPHHGGWRVILVRADGRRKYSFFEERADADQYKAILEQRISTILYTTDSAREAFIKRLTDRKLSPRTIEGYEWAIGTMWPASKPLRAVSKETIKERYAELVGSLSTDSHRNALKMSKTFLRWCIDQGWLVGFDLDSLKGEGSRRKGKPQLRLDEARRFYRHCVARADEGDAGAVAALMALLLTMRSECEILATVARDLDDGGRLLVIDESKTEAGERAIVVPEELQGPLRRMAEGLPPEGRLFRRGDRKWLWDEVQRLCTEAGVPKVCPHGLRGGGATAAKQQHVASLAISAALGHASTRVTEEHYIDKGAAKAADRERALVVLRGGKAG